MNSDDGGRGERQRTTTTTTTTTRLRRRPNILITGTPGTGKTSTATLIAERIAGLEHVNVGALIEQHHCYDDDDKKGGDGGNGRDEELDTNILDEDKLLDVLEGIFDAEEDDNDNDDGDADDNTAVGGGLVADFHMCDIFPERWFDLVLVLRTSTEVLFDRLTKRGYNDKKRSQNMEAEIMQVILEEAREAYAPVIVHEVPSNTVADMEANVERVASWCQQWEKDNN